MQTRLKAWKHCWLAQQKWLDCIWRSLFVGYVSFYGIFRTGIVHQDSLPIHWRFHYIVYGSSSFAFIFRVCFGSFLARSAQSKFENVARTPSVGYTILCASIDIPLFLFFENSAVVCPLLRFPRLAATRWFMEWSCAQLVRKCAAASPPLIFIDNFAYYHIYILVFSVYIKLRAAGRHGEGRRMWNFKKIVIPRITLFIPLLYSTVVVMEPFVFILIYYLLHPWNFDLSYRMRTDANTMEEKIFKKSRNRYKNCLLLFTLFWNRFSLLLWWTTYI